MSRTRPFGSTIEHTVRHWACAVCCLDELNQPDGSIDFLEENNIIQPISADSPASDLSSPDWYRSSSGQPAGESQLSPVTEESMTSPDVRLDAPTKISPDRQQALGEKNEETGKMIEEDASRQPAGLIVPKSSKDSLSIKIRDSIEDLQSPVPRSPRSTARRGRSPGKATTDIPPSPTRPIKVSPAKSPLKLRKKQKQKESMIINLGGADFDLIKHRRPLSPFTAGGFLRRRGGDKNSPTIEIQDEIKLGGDNEPEPPSAPAALTEFGPSIWEEVAELERAQQEWDEAKRKATGHHRQQEKEEEECTDRGGRTTRQQRGGKRLMGILGRRTVGPMAERDIGRSEDEGGEVKTADRVL